LDHQRNIETPAARKFVLSRGLPKTGQITSYIAGDDGAYETGWWRGRLNANNKTRYRLSFPASDTVFDLATGLMWAANGNGEGCNYGNPETWLNSLAYTANLDFGGFDDWRLPNVKELLSLIEYDAALAVGALPLIAEPPFSNTPLLPHWTSTTTVNLTTSAQIVNFAQGNVVAVAKVDSWHLRAVRGGV